MWQRYFVFDPLCRSTAAADCEYSQQIFCGGQLVRRWHKAHNRGKAGGGGVKKLRDWPPLAIWHGRTESTAVLPKNAVRQFRTGTKCTKKWHSLKFGRLLTPWIHFWRKSIFEYQSTHDFCPVSQQMPSCVNWWLMTNLCLKLALCALELVVRVHVSAERGSWVRRECAQVAVVDLKEE